MSLPGESKKLLNKKLLDLESGLPLTRKDFLAMKRSRGGHDLNLAGYIIWLEEIGAFETRKVNPKIYAERFEL